MNHVFSNKEQSVLKSIIDAFEIENMQTQYSVLGYRIDLYFYDCKLTIEVDEFGHSVKNVNYEMQRQKAIQKELNCKFVGVNHDKEDFNIFREMNNIHSYIKESTKNSTKKSLIGIISKQLLELELKKQLNKSKVLKICY